jgi:hypothetical protein
MRSGSMRQPFLWARMARTSSRNNCDSLQTRFARSRRRLFLRSKTPSRSTTSRGRLPASAAPCENARLYRFPAFGSAERLIIGEGLLSGKITNLLRAAYGYGRVGPHGG